MNNNFNVPDVFKKEFINQGELILKSFGLNSLKAKIYTGGLNDPFKPTEEKTYTSNAFSNQATQEENSREEGLAAIYNGDFGLPVLDILVLGGVKYETMNVLGAVTNITLPTVTLGIALLEVNQTKNIVTTSVQGRNGTIKEYISDGDFMINIKGILASNAQDTYPVDLFNALLKYCTAPVSFPASSLYLNRFGITDLVIQDYSFPQVEGVRNIQPFEIKCLSETPFEIKTKIS
jgi:hypothetical protein